MGLIVDVANWPIVGGLAMGYCPVCADWMSIHSEHAQVEHDLAQEGPPSPASPPHTCGHMFHIVGKGSLEHKCWIA